MGQNPAPFRGSEIVGIPETKEAAATFKWDRYLASRRLRQRTRLMSSEDLVAALLMRKEAAEKRAASQSAAAPVPTEGTSQSSGTKGKLAVPTGAATKEADAASSSGPSVQLPPPEAQDMEIDREPEASEADRDGEASMEE